MQVACCIALITDVHLRKVALRIIKVSGASDVIRYLYHIIMFDVRSVIRYIITVYNNNNNNRRLVTIFYRTVPYIIYRIPYI